MKAVMKGLIIGIVVIAIGVGLLVGAAALNGWKWRFTPDFVSAEYLSQQDITSLEITVNYGELSTEFYDGDCIKIEYPSASGWNPKIRENNGKLTFTSRSFRWFDVLSWFTKAPEITIYLPYGTAYDLDIELNAGTCKIADGTYGKVEIDVDAGTLDLLGAECERLECDVSAGKLTAVNIVCPYIDCEVSAGHIKLEIEGFKSEYTIKTDVSAGSCNVSNQTGTTDKKLFAECSAGSIEVKFAFD